MTPASDYLLIPVSIGALLCVMALVRLAAARLSLSAELQRKLVHVATGLYALSLPYTFASHKAVMTLLVLSLIVLAILRLPIFARSGGVASAVHGVKRRSHGELYLTIAVGLIYWFSRDNLVLYVLPILTLTLSDAAAALAGTRYGSRHFAVEAGVKSWEGVAMFFMVTLILSMVVLLLMSDVDRGRVVVLSTLIAAFGSLVEAESWSGLDNLFVPVGVHLLLATHIDTPTTHLLVLAAGFLLMLAFAAPLGAAVGLSAHSARAYLVLAFLICAVTDIHNALIPLLAVFAHIAARMRRPCRSAYPDLDLLAVAAGVALFWLFAGETSGANALNVYNLTFAGMAMIFLALACADAGRLRLAFVAFGALVLFGLTLSISTLNPGSAVWHGVLWPWIAASLALCGGVALLAPASFNRYRSVRAVFVALLAPLLLFLIKGLAA